MNFSVGMIGSGSMGRAHTYSYDKLNECYEDVRIDKKVICSPHITAEKAEGLGWSATETDWEKVVARQDIDIIDVSPYDYLHYPIAKAALLNGKLVICEKPLADNAEQARELVELALKRNIDCTVCYNYRYMHAVRCIKHLVSSGELGEIRHVFGSFIMDWAVNTEKPMYWRLDDKISPAGALGDLGTHLIDLCRFIGLEFTEVCGMNEVYGKQRKSGDGLVATTANELSVFTTRFQNDALGLFELSRVSGGGGMAFEVHGTKGNIRWEKNAPNELDVYIPGKSEDGRKYRHIGASEILPLDYKWDHEFIQNDGFTLLFHDYLTGNGKSPTFKDGLESCKVNDAVIKSDREKRTVCIK